MLAFSDKLYQIFILALIKGQFHSLIHTESDSDLSCNLSWLCINFALTEQMFLDKGSSII